jgi:CheY-like chemotaxis protein
MSSAVQRTRASIWSARVEKQSWRGPKPNRSGPGSPTCSRAPFAVSVVMGPQHVFKSVNEFARRLIGYRDALNLPMKAAFPESEMTGVRAMLDRVFATGDTVVTREQPIGWDRMAAIDAFMALAIVSLGTSPSMTSDQERTSRAVRVLIVDDNRDATDLLREVLSRLGYEIRIAYAGATALEVARNFRPQIALLDIGMPEMDGFELGRQLHQLDARIRLVTVSGYHNVAKDPRATATEFVGHLLKPVQLDLLRRIIDAAPAT